MSQAIKLPISKCDITIRVGTDGVWLSFGKYTTFHVGNTFAGRGVITDKNLIDWILAREAQAKTIKEARA